jgi:group I intron endonuclease
MKQIIIYSARNTFNDKLYIGQTQDFKKRKREHKCFARSGSFLPFHKAIRKYGFDAFEFNIMYKAKDGKQADAAEQFCIRVLKTRDSRFGYNIAEGGLVNRGYKISLQGRKNNRKAQRKFWDSPRGMVLRRKKSKELRGRTLSLSTRKKMGKASKALWDGPRGAEMRSLLRERVLGNTYAAGHHHTLSEEQRRIRSERLKGNQNCLGRKLSEQTKHKIAAKVHNAAIERRKHRKWPRIECACGCKAFLNIRDKRGTMMKYKFLQGHGRWSLEEAA